VRQVRRKNARLPRRGFEAVRGRKQAGGTYIRRTQTTDSLVLMHDESSQSTCTVRNFAVNEMTTNPFNFPEL
jgi:hypothetical protein